MGTDMSGVHCAKFPTCWNVTNDATIPRCEKSDCPGRLTFHAIFSGEFCAHDFQGWRDHKDDQGRIVGGEQVCTKCGMGAMHYSIMTGP
jgi:hypothetical protein